MDSIEVRHKSWFDNEAYKLLSDNIFAWLGTSWMLYRHLRRGFLYLRFIGDRSIDEKDFGRLQKDRIKKLRLWSHSVQGVKNKAKYAIVAANNHYAGFGPATANSFRKMVGLKEAVWEEMKQSRL